MYNAMLSCKIVLNIHKHTELGDNDSVKKNKSNRKNTLENEPAQNFQCCQS